jgi:NTE family protein
MSYPTKRCLVLSGGGIKGLLFLGALYYLEEKQQIHSFECFCATSVGSIICFLLTIGYSPIEILSYICSHDISKGLEVINISTLISKQGAFSFTPILDTIKELMSLKKISTEIDLEGLFDITQKDLYITTYNKTQSKTEYLHHLTHPKMKVLDALRASCSLPLVFPRFYVSNSEESIEFLDGGITDNFPLRFMDLKLSLDYSIIGIGLDRQDYHNTPNENSIVDYIYSIFVVPFNIIKLRNEGISHRVKYYLIPADELGSFEFKMDIKTKIKHFSFGYRKFGEVYEKKEKIE